MIRLFAILACSLFLNIAQAAAQTPYEQLRFWRQLYPTPMTKAQIGELLNRVAWDYRAEGMRLLGKSGGNNCPTPSGALISCDYLVHAPSLTGHDVLYDEGAVARPVRFVWGPGPEDLREDIERGARSIVEPVPPVSAPGSSPTTPPPPSLEQQMGELLARQIVIEGVVADIRQQNLVHETAEAAERARQEAFRRAVGSEYKKLGLFVTKYVLPALAALEIGRRLGD